MKFIALSALVLVTASMASAALPTIKVNNVDHYLADYDESTDTFFETTNGYCVLNGFNYAEMTTGTQADVKPLVELDANGNVLRTFPDNQNGKIWVAMEVTCGK